MKPVQVMFDESLLQQLDSSPEVKRLGRSAVLRAATADYLRSRRREEIAAQYRQAYAGGEGLGPEWSGWEEEGTWPSE